MDTSHDPTHGLVRALRPARLLEAEQSALASHVLLFKPLAPRTAPGAGGWGGRQGGRGPE